MKIIYTFFVILLISSSSRAQEKFITKQGRISFFSHSLVEDIVAENNQVLSLIDSKTGEIAISVLMKSFMFEKSLMQEHFNENYIESDKYPKAIFRGEILDFHSIDSGEQQVFVKGNLTIHGIVKSVKTKAIIEVTKEKIILKGNFQVEVADFKIKIPSIVINNIAKIIKISFDLNHKPFKR